MSANYCPDCGAELAQNARFCSECGSGIGESDTSQQVPVSQPESSTTQEEEPSNTMFKATSGLVAGYFLFVILGFWSSSTALIGLGVLCMPVSLVTMYVDLRDLEENLWDTRPILWVVGAVLLYIVVAPLYIYKRRQAA